MKFKRPNRKKHPSREAAIIAGVAKYNTSKPCKKGHNSDRYTATGDCCQCQQIWTTAYHKRNSEKLTEYAQQRYTTNLLSYKAYTANKRAKAYGAPGIITEADIKCKLDSQKYTCKYCSIELNSTFHVDHILPFKKNGTNFPTNIQCLCEKCNKSKGSKYVSDYLIWLSRNCKHIVTETVCVISGTMRSFII